MHTLAPVSSSSSLMRQQHPIRWSRSPLRSKQFATSMVLVLQVICLVLIARFSVQSTLADALMCQDSSDNAMHCLANDCSTTCAFGGGQGCTTCVTNALFSYRDFTDEYGSVAHTTCQSFYTFVGSWVAPAVRVNTPSCGTPLQCPDPTGGAGVASTTISYNNNGGSNPCYSWSMTFATHGIACSIDCNTAGGYQSTGGSKTLTCDAANAQWVPGAGGPLTCGLIPTTCSAAPSSQPITGVDYTASCNGVQSTTSCTGQCKSGYHASAPFTLTCTPSSNTWASSVTTPCVPVCDSPPLTAVAATAASINLAGPGSPSCNAASSTSSVSANSICSVACATGYHSVGSADTFTCTGSNTWTQQIGCVPNGASCTTRPSDASGFKVNWNVGTCGTVGSVTTASSPSTFSLIHGATCSFGCQTGYIPNGNAICVNGVIKADCIGYTLASTMYAFATKINAP